MMKKLSIMVIGFALVLASSGLAFGEKINKNIAMEENLSLGRNLVINLTMDSPNDKEELNSVTASKYFLMQMERKQNNITKNIRLKLQEISLRSKGKIFLRYKLDMQKEGDNESFSTHLDNIVLLDLNKEIVIGKTKDVTFKLKISNVK